MKNNKNIQVILLTVLILTSLLFIGICTSKIERSYKQILDYRTENNITYHSTFIKDNTGETFILYTYGLEDLERLLYNEMYRKLIDIAILETPIQDLFDILPDLEPKLYEDFRIRLTSNGKGWSIEK